MDFEELQVIWNTQDQQPLFAVREARVQAALWQQRRDSRRSWFRWNILSGYLAGGLWLIGIAATVLLHDEPGVFPNGATISISWRAATLFAVSAALLVYFLARIARTQQQEKRREGPISGSLREEVERGIAHVEYQIREGGAWKVGIAAMPLMLATFLAASAYVEATGLAPWLPALMAGVTVLGFPMEAWRQHRRVTRDLLPRKRALESLRTRLSSPPS